MILHSEWHPKSVTELHGAEKREEEDRGDKKKREGSKRERIV